jgi:hypothetical protein
MLALLTTTYKRVSYSRTVYVTRDLNEHDTLVLIDGMEFHLYIAVPQSLDPYQLYDAMMNAYYGSMFSKAKREAIVKELEQVEDDLAAFQDEVKKRELSFMEKKMNIFRNNFESHNRYRELLRDEDVLTMAGNQKIAHLKREMKDGSYFFIKEMKQFFVPRHARVSSKLKSTTQWRFTFDNHCILQFFINKFRKPFEIGRTYDGIAYQILILDNDGDDPSLYHGAAINHYMTRQTQQFPHENHFYKWHFSTHNTPSHALFEPVFQSLLDTSVANVESDASRLLPDYVRHNTMTFDWDDFPTINIKLVSMSDKEFLLSKDTRVRKKKEVEEEKVVVTNAKRKTYLGKNIQMHQSSLSFGETTKKLKIG